MTRFDVVVVGGGPAGVTAALRARELGAAVALVERARMGGTCTNDGCAPTRVLAKAARLIRDTEQYDEYGLAGQPPTVDLPELVARTQQTIYRLHEKKQLIAHLEQAGVRVWTDAGEARFADAHTLLLPQSAPETSRIEAEHFILCVGGHARRLNFTGSENALTLSDVWQMTRVPGELVIIGAAATGCQLASIFAAFGSRVTLLDVAPRILAVEDDAVCTAMSEAFERRGVKTITGIGGVDRIERRADGLTVHYQHQGNAQAIAADTVIMAVGWVGNVEQLGLEAAAVRHERGYISVNDYLQTSAPHIFAAGDITGRMMLVQSAAHEARVAAENAVLGAHRPFRHRIVPHGGFTDPEYGSVGLTESQATKQAEGVAVAVVPYTDMDRAVIDSLTEGFCKLIVSRESRRIVGAHVVGEQAVEIVQMVAAGMAAEMRVEQLAELELAYPTYTAIVGLAARQIVRDLGLTPLAPEWRTLRRLGERVAEWERFEQ